MATTDPKKRRTLATVFFPIGVAFTTIGVSGQPAFLGVGIALLGMAIVFLARSRRPGDRQ